MYVMRMGESGVSHTPLPFYPCIGVYLIPYYVLTTPTEPPKLAKAGPAALSLPLLETDTQTLSLDSAPCRIHSLVINLV